jgi:hypothetical protein
MPYKYYLKSALYLNNMSYIGTVPDKYVLVSARYLNESYLIAAQYFRNMS